jgi:hypothetical protein
MPKMSILGINVCIGGRHFAAGFRRPLVSLGGDHQFVHLLHGIFPPNKFRSEPIEQRLVRRFAAQFAKVAGQLEQALAEMPLPHAVHSHPREERILRSRQPIGKSLDAAVAKVRRLFGKRPAGLGGMILFGAGGFATR